MKTQKNPEPVNLATAQAIEDAILFGHIKEIDAVLEQIRDEDGFPEDLRHGLEALRYFRTYYGKDGVAEPQHWLQKQKAAVIESSWSSGLLEMLRQNEDRAVKQA